MARIVLTAFKKGGMAIQTEGFKGSTCMQKSKFLEDALGAAVQTDYTAEYYESEQTVSTDQEIES